MYAPDQDCRRIWAQAWPIRVPLLFLYRHVFALAYFLFYANFPTKVFLGLFGSIYKLIPQRLRQLTEYRRFLSRVTGRDEVGAVGEAMATAANAFVDASLRSLDATKHK